MLTAREQSDPLASLLPPFPDDPVYGGIAVPLIWFTPLSDRTREQMGVPEGMLIHYPAWHFDPALQGFYDLIQGPGEGVENYEQIPGSKMMIRKEDAPPVYAPCKLLWWTIQTGGDYCLNMGVTGRDAPFLWLTPDGGLSGYSVWATITLELMNHAPRLEKCKEAFEKAWLRLNEEHGLGGA